MPVRLATALLGLASVLPACSDSARPEYPRVLAGITYRLEAIDGLSLPVTYYQSADGTYSVSATAGSLAFVNDSVVEWRTDRVIHWPTSPVTNNPQSGFEATRYRVVRDLLLIARSETAWDSGLVDDQRITMRFTHEGIPIGAWRFAKVHW